MFNIQKKFNANCGCGVSFRLGEMSPGSMIAVQSIAQVLKAAEAHSQATGHTMEFLGEFRVEKTPTYTAQRKESYNKRLRDRYPRPKAFESDEVVV